MHPDLQVKYNIIDMKQNILKSDKKLGKCKKMQETTNKAWQRRKMVGQIGNDSVFYGSVL